MSIQSLNIEEKTNNVDAPGISGTAHKLTAAEFNLLVNKVNELVSQANKTVYLTQDEYDALVDSGSVKADVEYNIFDE